MWILLRTDQIYPYVFVYSLKIPYQISTSSQSFKTTSQHHFSLFCHSSTQVWQMHYFPKLQLFTRTNSKKEKIPNQNPSIHPSINCLLLIWFEVTWRRGLASCPSYYEVTKPPKNVNILVQQRYFSSFPLDLLWIFQFTSWIIITVRISILWLNNAH